MRAVRRLLRRFVRERRAVAAVEFALILPVMMVMYLGTVELARAVANGRKVTLLARTLADLAARGPVTSTTDIFKAGAAVLAPFDASGATLVISAIGVYGDSAAAQGRVCSSAGNKGTGLAAKTVVPVPAGFQVDKTRFLRADVSMTYTPLLGSNILQWVTGRSSIQITESTPWPTRTGDPSPNGNGPEVVLPGGSACPKTP